MSPYQQSGSVVSVCERWPVILRLSRVLYVHTVVCWYHIDTYVWYMYTVGSNVLQLSSVQFDRCILMC